MQVPAAHGRDAHLDGVRGLAALMVVLSHIVLAFQPALLGGPAATAHFAASVPLGHTGLVLLYNPNLAVAVFFVLSGYVLAGSAGAGRAGFAELALRRYVRLALPVLAASVLPWLLARAGLFHAEAAGGLAKSDWLATLYAWAGPASADFWRMAWLALVGCFAFGPYDYNSALWTMPTEFWGSLMVFAVYRGLPGTLASREGGLVVAALAIALGWNTNFAGFAYGIALFEVMRRLQPRRDRAAPIGFAPVGFAPAGFALFGAGLVLGGMPYVVDLEAGATYARIFLALAPHVQNPVALLHGLAALCLVAAVLLWRPLQVGLMTGLCQFLGRVSFSLYLVHVPVLCALAGVLLPRWAPALGYNAASAALAGLVLAVSLALAALGTRFVDRPAVALARRAGRTAVPLIRLARRRVRGNQAGAAPVRPG